MTTQRKPTSHLYDGWLYARLIEPLAKGLHGFVCKSVPEGVRVLDACCGTGALSLRLAEKSTEVVGVDLSPRHIRFAEKRRQKRAVENLRFELGDAAHLDRFDDDAFDTATILLALHEMPPETRQPVLREVARVAQRLLVVDFHVPMPKNLTGIGNRFIEMSAGREHFGNYRDFQRRGGLPALVEEAGLKVDWERKLDKGTLLVNALSR